MMGLKITALTLATGLAWTHPVYVASAHEGEQHDQSRQANEESRRDAGEGRHDMEGGHHNDDEGHHEGEGHAEGSHGDHGHDEGHGHGDHHTFGHPGDAADVDRTLKVAAVDTDFDHETIGVTPGETVRFVLENKGQLVHEFTIGPPHMQRAHQREMANIMQNGAMTATSVEEGVKHAHANSVLLEPGETKEIIWTFSKEADVHFACNVPGHYEAGMHGEFAFHGSSGS